MIEVVETPIDEAAILAAIKSDAAGACVLFSGTTRQFTAGRETSTLRYQAYGEMAIKKLEWLKAEATREYSLQECCIVHRLGEVPIGESSVVVGVSSAHRKDAFRAAEWIMDTLKREVPIWKQEVWADGTEEWIHPDKNVPSTSNEVS